MILNEYKLLDILDSFFNFFCKSTYFILQLSYNFIDEFALDIAANKVKE